MSDDDIDYAEDPPRPRYSYKGGGKFDGAIKAILLAVVIAAIIGGGQFVLGMNATIANINGSIANLRLTDEFLREQIKDVKGDVDQMRGKVFRSDGTPRQDFFDADQPQSK